MKTSTSTSLQADHKRKRSFLCTVLTIALFLAAVFFIASILVVMDYTQRFLGGDTVASLQNTSSNMCETQCRPSGSEALPKGIASRTSDLAMRPLAGPENNKKSKPTNLLAMAVGVKQKQNVDKIVKKFPSDKFVVMLFHYDGIVDAWKDLKWTDQAIHISAVNQTKWWFAKRFLHPDIVSEYVYIFLWDEDLGVEHFDAVRYLSIIKKEGFEISQPALEPNSEVHHPLTERQVNSTVHRKINRTIGGGRKCDYNSTDPPCTGWVEMMAPVFSRASWHCTWHMIQNDLVHAWGLDFQLGYCAQGDRTKTIGIVDSEYVVHQGLPTLGGPENKRNDGPAVTAAQKAPPSSEESSGRSAVRKRCYTELEIFKNRWKKAVKEDSYWTDPYKKPEK